jgi:predicted RNase H-like HicB family nuclease
LTDGKGRRYLLFMRARYTVAYEKDRASSVWTASIDPSQGAACVSQGRSIGEARKRIREALSVYLDDDRAAERAELIDDVKLPARVKAAVLKSTRLREAAEAAQSKSIEVSTVAAQLLTNAGISRRDAAEMLGVSYQRVQQLSAKRPGRARATARSK